MNMLAPLSEPVGWRSTTNFTRALEPTLSWNQFIIAGTVLCSTSSSQLLQRGAREEALPLPPRPIPETQILLPRTAPSMEKKSLSRHENTNIFFYLINLNQRTFLLCTTRGHFQCGMTTLCFEA